MTNKKRKGFTIVELVIVIAVIAILAGVLIPTFASIIDKANQSADIQAVRQMNVLLKAESVEETLSFNKVIEIVGEAGYTDTKLTPKSKDHGFYWYSEENLIVLVKDKTELVYPKDNETINGIFIEGFDITTNTDFKNLATEVEPGEGGTEGGTLVGDPLNDELLNEDNGGVLETKDDVLYLKGGTYYLTENTTFDTAITISEDVTIDLNGQTLEVNGCKVEGSLTIKNGDIKIMANIIVSESAENSELTLEGVKIEVACVFSIENYGKLHINKSEVYAIAPQTIATANYAEISNTTIYVSNKPAVFVYSGNCEISKCTFVESGAGVQSIECYGDLTLNDVTIDNDDISNKSVNATDTSTITINGGTYDCYLYSNGSVTINNGTYNGLVSYSNGTVSNGTFNGEFCALSGIVTISGGTFNNTVQLDGINVSATLNITGGEFKTNSTENIIIEAVGKGEINITGGEFKGKIKMTWGHETPQSHINIFNYNSNDGPKFYNATTGNYTSFSGAGYSENNSGNIILSKNAVSKPIEYTIDNTTYNAWVIANANPYANYSPNPQLNK